MWTFGICLGNNSTFLDSLIVSIKRQQELNKDIFEIIVIGPINLEISTIIEKHKSEINISHIVFEEKTWSTSFENNPWITLKKNILIQNAKFENICLMHDYIGLCAGWYMGFQKFGYDWDVCMTPVLHQDGRRFRDWIRNASSCQLGDVQYVDYEDNKYTQKMYISGAYWCGKKDYMLKHPQHINRLWDQGEDVYWSLECQSTWKYVLNPISCVRCLKDKSYDLRPHPDTNPNKNYSIQDIQK